MLENKRDDSANDSYTDHPHRMDKPHSADTWKHRDDHHHIKMAESTTSWGVGVDFVVFLNDEAVDKDTHEEFVDAAVFVEVAGEPEKEG